MILTCPRCSTRYQADEAEFPSSGRDVRCTKCGHIWHQSAPESGPEAVSVEPEPAEPPPRSEPPSRSEPPPRSEPPRPEQPETSEFEPAPRRRAYVGSPAYEVKPQAAPRARSPWPRRLALTMGWIGLIAIVAALGWAGVFLRQEIVTAWPQTASLYAKLGIKANASGFEIYDVRSRENIQNGLAVLEVAGTLRNVSNRELPVPRIRVALSGGDEHELYHWTFAPRMMTLRPGQATSFVTRLSDPPAGARHLNVRLASSRE